MQPLAQAHAHEHLPRLRLGVVLVGKLERQHHVLERGERRQKLEGLEYEPDAAPTQLRALVFIEGKQARALDVHFARARRVETGEDRKQRRFARTGGADDGHRLPARDRELDLAQNDEVRIPALHGFPDAAHAQHLDR